MISNNQQSAWEEFLNGDCAFVENGTWQLSSIKDSGIEYGILPIPGRDGGTAAAPTGGVFVTLPAQSDDSTYEVSAAWVDCLTSPENALEIDTTLSYVSALADVQQEQVAADPDRESWVDAGVRGPRSHADGLGTGDPVISEQFWNGVEASLSGSQAPEAALDATQQAAGTN